MKQVIISLLIVITGAYLLVNLGRRVYDLYKTNDRLILAQKKLTEAQKKNEELRLEQNYRQSNFYIEKEAREKLNMARPNEKVAIITGFSETQLDKQNGSKKVPNWQKWYQLFFEE